jgi:hypothetical protein
VFVASRPFQQSVPKTLTREMCKDNTRPKMPDRYKRSSLLRALVNYGGKKVLYHWILVLCRNQSDCQRPNETCVDVYSNGQSYCVFVIDSNNLNGKWGTRIIPTDSNSFWRPFTVVYVYFEIILENWFHSNGRAFIPLYRWHLWTDKQNNFFEKND